MLDITLTLPMEFGAILQQNRHILHVILTMERKPFNHWAKARYGVWWIVLVIQQTFGGFLNFIPHLNL